MLISIYFYAYRVPGMFQLLLYWYINGTPIVYAIPLPEHIHSSKNKFYDTMLLWRAHHNSIRTNRKNPIIGTYVWCNDTCIVPGIPRPLGRRFAFYRFIVSLSFCRYRYRYRNSFGTVSSYRYRTIIPKLSVRYPAHYICTSAMERIIQQQTTEEGRWGIILELVSVLYTELYCIIHTVYEHLRIA